MSNNRHLEILYNLIVIDKLLEMSKQLEHSVGILLKLFKFSCAHGYLICLPHGTAQIHYDFVSI